MFLHHYYGLKGGVFRSGGDKNIIYLWEWLLPSLDNNNNIQLIKHLYEKDRGEQKILVNGK